jgi:Phage integrase, N-terminal SAM-like domain
MSGQLPTEIPFGNRLLTAAEFHRLADVPPEVEWFANISNPHTRRAYENAVKDFMHFAGFRRPEEFRAVTRAHIIGWRDDLVLRGLGGSTTRHRLASLASLFEYLCERNAVTHNPVKGVARRSGRQISSRQAGIAGDRQAPASGAVDPGDGFDYLDDGGNTASAHRASVAPTAEIIPPATWLRASQAGTNVRFHRPRPRSEARVPRLG